MQPKALNIVPQTLEQATQAAQKETRRRAVAKMLLGDAAEQALRNQVTPKPPKAGWL
jgi:hypothetical protein